MTTISVSAASTHIILIIIIIYKMDKTNKTNKKKKLVNVKQKLHHPVKPKKKSHLGEYFAELIIIILFLGSIAITIYKYLGKGKFIERTLDEPININTDGSVGFNVIKSDGTSDDGNSSLEIYSKNNNVFDISSYSDSVYVDFKSKDFTMDRTPLGELTINDTKIFSFVEQTIPISDQAGGKIQFGGKFGYNLDCYGRFKGTGIMQNTSSGAIFNGGITPGGCKDTSLIMQFLLLAKSMPSGYLSKDAYIKSGTLGLYDSFISNKTGDTAGIWWLLTTPSGNGISLNSTNIVTFPNSSTATSNSIVLPIPGKNGDFINFLFVKGTSLAQPANNFLIRNLAFRCTNGEPFMQNSLLRSINFQQALTTMTNSGKFLTYKDVKLNFFDTREHTQTLSIYVSNMFATNGSSNMIFLNVFSRNDYTVDGFNFDADGTTVKFVSVNGHWAVEGNSYSDSAFFTAKTG